MTSSIALNGLSVVRSNTSRRIASGGLVQRQQANADIVDVHVEPVHLMVALDDDLSELGIAVHQRLYRLLNLILDQSSHVEDFLAELL